jgi:ribosomal protein S18 acetylase RimI-like enzyme
MSGEIVGGYPRRVPGNDVTIRAASAADVDAIVAFWSDEAEPTVADDRISLARLFERDAGALLVAERDGAIVGTLVAAWDGWRGNMYRLAVLSPSRRAGIAMALVRAGEERLIGLGAQRITALVVGAHDDATGFWMAAGYEHDVRMARYVKTIDRGST